MGKSQLEITPYKTESYHIFKKSIRFRVNRTTDFKIVAQIDLDKKETRIIDIFKFRRTQIRGKVKTKKTQTFTLESIYWEKDFPDIFKIILFVISYYPSDPNKHYTPKFFESFEFSKLKSGIIRLKQDGKYFISFFSHPNGAIIFDSLDNRFMKELSSEKKKIQLFAKKFLDFIETLHISYPFDDNEPLSITSKKDKKEINERFDEVYHGKIDTPLPIKASSYADFEYLFDSEYVKKLKVQDRLETQIPKSTIVFEKKNHRGLEQIYGSQFTSETFVKLTHFLSKMLVNTFGDQAIGNAAAIVLKKREIPDGEWSMDLSGIHSALSSKRHYYRGLYNLLNSPSPFNNLSSRINFGILSYVFFISQENIKKVAPKIEEALIKGRKFSDTLIFWMMIAKSTLSIEVYGEQLMYNPATDSKTIVVKTEIDDALTHEFYNLAYIDEKEEKIGIPTSDGFFVENKKDLPSIEIKNETFSLSIFIADMMTFLLFNNELMTHYRYWEKRKIYEHEIEFSNSYIIPNFIILARSKSYYIDIYSLTDQVMIDKMSRLKKELYESTKKFGDLLKSNKESVISFDTIRDIYKMKDYTHIKLKLGKIMGQIDWKISDEVVEGL